MSAIDLIRAGMMPVDVSDIVEEVGLRADRPQDGAERAYNAQVTEADRARSRAWVHFLGVPRGLQFVLDATAQSNISTD